MLVQPIKFNSYNNMGLKTSQPTFDGGGKPITLQYIVENRAHILPKRVLNATLSLLKTKEAQLPSLMELHRRIYAPLLSCKTLDEAKKIFPEFCEMKGSVEFQRDTRYSREFKERTDENFALKMLQDFWAKLKTKDEIAQEMGMRSRSTLDWPLQQIGFVSYHPNYKVILRASDEEGNQVIAAKTTAWNAAHPDLMRAKNKHAAQGCKTEEFKVAQSERIKEYDKLHPERREKISMNVKRAWEACPEIRSAMAEFALTCPGFMRRVVVKRFKGMELSQSEIRTDKTFFKMFWNAYPELKEVYAKAMKREC